MLYCWCFDAAVLCSPPSPYLLQLQVSPQFSILHQAWAEQYSTPIAAVESSIASFRLVAGLADLRPTAAASFDSCASSCSESCCTC